MDIIEAIHARRSIRKFAEGDVTKEQIETILRAGMAAPSAHNGQPWRFLVVDDKDDLKKIGKINRFARLADDAPLGILVCADKASLRFEGFWEQDCGACVQNMLLAITALGLGGVWTGISQLETSRMVKEAQEAYNLPEHIIPFAMVVIGPKGQDPAPVDRFDPDKVHYSKW